MRETVFREILQREGKTVVNAYQRSDHLGETLYEPVSNPFARQFLWGLVGTRLRAARSRDPHVDAQAFEAGLTRLRAGVVHPEYLSKALLMSSCPKLVERLPNQRRTAPKRDG